jgi:hypothetical protein
MRDPKQRLDDQWIITDFIEKIFGSKEKLYYNDFQDLNTNISSEMFVAIMRVLHNKLPCSKNFFVLR